MHWECYATSFSVTGTRGSGSALCGPCRRRAVAQSHMRARRRPRATRAVPIAPVAALIVMPTQWAASQQRWADPRAGPSGGLALPPGPFPLGRALRIRPQRLANARSAAGNLRSAPEPWACLRGTARCSCTGARAAAAARTRGRRRPAAPAAAQAAAEAAGLGQQGGGGPEDAAEESLDVLEWRDVCRQVGAWRARCKSATCARTGSPHKTAPSPYATCTHPTRHRWHASAPPQWRRRPPLRG